MANRKYTDESEAVNFNIYAPKKLKENIKEYANKISKPFEAKKITITVSRQKESKVLKSIKNICKKG
jgi:hypothetical protein